MSPPWASISPRQMYSPRPVPVGGPGHVAAGELLEDRPERVVRDAGALVGDGDDAPTLFARHDDGDRFRPSRVLLRVLDEVRQDLPELVRVAPDLDTVARREHDLVLLARAHRARRSPHRPAPGRPPAAGAASSLPASRRETSRSSVRIRVTRSASSLIARSISSLMSSFRRSQRSSSVFVKPLIVVSGERISCETVAMSSIALSSRSSRAARLARRPALRRTHSPSAGAPPAHPR